MATAPNATIDAALARVALATAVHVCTSEPANHAGIAAVTVGNYTLTAGDGNGDWTIADGDVSGRKLTLGAQTGNNGTGTGAANFLAFTDGTTLHFVSVGDGDTVNTGQPFTIGSYDVWEIEDPA